MKRVGKDGWISYTDSYVSPSDSDTVGFAGMEFPFMVFNGGRIRDVHEVLRFTLWPSGIATWQDGYKIVKTVRP